MVLVIALSHKNTQLKAHVVLWVSASQGKPQPFQVWWPQLLSKWRYTGFSLPRDLATPHDQSVI